MSKDNPVPVQFDIQMRRYVERQECSWVKDHDLPRGVTVAMAEAWFRLEGYIRDKHKVIGWRKPVIRRTEGAD